MKLKHLEHVEDYLFAGSMTQSIDVLWSLGDALSGTQSPHLKISTKYDGAPSIVFGVNPETNEFFVGTKSVFNKTPKVCYNEQDVYDHHGHDIGLCDKLIEVLKTLRFEYWNASIPKGIFQGDLLWLRDSKTIDDRTVSFTPNTITYRANRHSALGIECETRSMGMVVHTQYDGPSISELKASFDVDQATFYTSGVVFIDPSVHIDDYRITQLDANTLVDSFTYVEKTWKSIPDRSIYVKHGNFLRMFYNHCVRLGEDKPETSMYEAFLRNRGETELVAEVQIRRVIFEAIFSMHRHLVGAKKIILKALNKTEQDFFTEVNGSPTEGEGYVVVFHGVPCKLVDRFEFSRLNFANQRFREKA